LGFVKAVMLHLDITRAWHCARIGSPKPMFVEVFRA
jgi:hypothetical protein